VTALIDAPAAADTRAAPRRVRRRGGLTPGKLTLTLAT
jgi:hypothetical protein